MGTLEFPLDPVETETIERVITPKRIRVKGLAVYSFRSGMRYWLEKNGWEFLSYKKRHRGDEAYLRSPGGIEADSFTLRIQVPNDMAILRLAKAFMVYCSQEGHFLKTRYHGRLGVYPATYYPNGHQTYKGHEKVLGVSEEQMLMDRSPTLEMYEIELWRVSVYWLGGVDGAPTWKRGE
jgi:hypothetical protein